MNALELVRQVTALTGFTHSAGVRVIAAEPGRVEMSLPKKPELLQFNGFFHGGIVSGLADHAAGAAATTALPTGKIAVTVDLHVNFLAPASGPAIVARARTIQVGATLCVVTVEVETEATAGVRLCAVANAVLRVVDMPPMHTPGG
ncbi:MAG: PaaI family thioesterase [Burkholderiales bacterium]